jgi:hypothetical protein
MKNPERAISTLTGMVHALFMSVQCLAKTHPNPQALLTELETAEQLGLANLEPHHHVFAFPLWTRALLAGRSFLSSSFGGLCFGPLFAAA